VAVRIKWRDAINAASTVMDLLMTVPADENAFAHFCIDLGAFSAEVAAFDLESLLRWV